MAHVARTNDLGASLVTCISGFTKHDPTFKQILADTTKGLRNASYARTNQFDVKSKLNGLVEKFAVLNRDDLAEALQSRLEELPAESKWLPEILSLLLLLSDRPVEKTALDNLEHADASAENQQALTWSEIFADAARDTSGIWDDVERGYHSSGDEATADEDGTISTKASSVGDEDIVSLARLHIRHPDELALHRIQKAREQMIGNEVDRILVSELIIIRETLSMLQGLETSVYDIEESTGKVSWNANFGIDTSTRQILNDINRRCAGLGSSINFLRNWVRKDFQILHLQSCQAATQDLLTNFASEIVTLEKKFASPQADTIVSMIAVLCAVEPIANPLLHLSRIVQESDKVSDVLSFSFLDLLYDEVCIAQISGDVKLATKLSRVLLAGLKTYLKPAATWLRSGSSEDYDGTFFVVETNKDCELGNIWHDRFTIRTFSDGRPAVPKLLMSLAPRILAFGRSRAFLTALDARPESLDEMMKQQLPDLVSPLERLNSQSLIPFSETLDEVLEAWISDIGEDCTPVLCKALLHEHGLLRTWNGLVEVFCSQNCRLTQSFADTLFWRMDTGKSWIDPFMLTELAQSTLGSAADVDLESITVAVADVPDSIANSSIRQLERLELRMLFSWPIQNVTRTKFSSSYSKIFSFLLQIYRSKYLLRQQALDLRSLDSQTRRLSLVVKAALALRQALVAVVDILYNQVTISASILSASLQRDVRAADGIDAMVRIWAEHERELEASLLLTANFKPIRDAVVQILEFCEPFCSVWKSSIAMPTSPESHGIENGQASTGPGSTSIAKSILDLQSQLNKSLSFLIAGLRATGRAGGNAALEALADRLDWKEK